MINKTEIRSFKQMAYIPMTPNFIRMDVGDSESFGCSIAEFSDKELKIIGESWTLNLIEKARKRRKK